MAKRTSLQERRTKDARGIDMFFPDSSAAEPGQATDTQGAVTAEPTKPPLAKVTLYIRPDQVLAVESIQLQQRQKTGKKPDKSDLIQEALDLLVEKYGSL